MNLSELRKLTPPPPPQRKGQSSFVRIFEAGAVVAIALLGYAVYAGLLEIPGLRGNSEAPRPAALNSSQPPAAIPSVLRDSENGPRIAPAAPAPSRPVGLPSAVQFFERQQPGDQTRFVSCVKLSGHEWRKVINALQAGIEPLSSQFATCMLSLNPGRLCEPSEVQNLTAFLKIHMEQKIAGATPEADNRSASAAGGARSELRTATASAALDKVFLTDLRELLAQGYLRIADIGPILPVEAQAALAAVTVERIACR